VVDESEKKQVLIAAEDPRNGVEIVCDGLAGGNFNSELIKMVLYSDKPGMVADQSGTGDGKGVQVMTFRLQAATLIVRRSRLRSLIKQMSDFADAADRMDTEQKTKRGATDASA
jgi:hypothetical protein